MTATYIIFIIIIFIFRIGDEIGSGHFGVVHRGVWNHSGKADQVAIKTLHDEVLEEERTKLLREAATVQQFLHINIIKFYGVITSRERVRISKIRFISC